MGINADGTFTKRRTDEIEAAVLSALLTQFGPTLDVGPASPARKLIEAAVVAPLAQTQNDMEDIYKQTFFPYATGQALDDVLQPFGFTRLQPTAATGVAELDLKLIPTTPSPLFASGSVTFKASDGNLYSMSTDMALPATVATATGTGTNSEVVDGAAIYKVAQVFTTTAEKYVQGFKLTGGVLGSSPTFTVTVETDSSGSPSGTLAHANLSKTGYAPTAATAVSAVFTKGAYLAAGTYWLVITRTAGTASFDGSGVAPLDQVKTYNGSAWSLSALVENLNYVVYETTPIPIAAQQLGTNANEPVGALTGTIFSSGTISTRWNTDVNTFGNQRSIAGGRNLETDVAFRARVRQAVSSSETASVNGIATALLDTVGVTGTTVLENTSTIGTSLDVLFDNSAHTGTATENIDGTTTKIAQKVVTTVQRWVQHFNVKETTVSGTPTFTVTLETNNAGAPSGTLAFAGASQTGFVPTTATVTGGTFDSGAFLATGTYWLVFTRTAGTATFDGNATGTTGDAQKNAGSWANLTTVKEINCQLIAGLPPKSFRAYVSGTASANTIASAIFNARAAGIYSDGTSSGTVTDVGGISHTEHYEPPTQAGVTISVTATYSTVFNADADALRDVLVSYIGGTDTKGVPHPGLAVGEKLVRLEAVARLLDPEDLPGIVDITTFRVGRKSTFATPAALTSAEVINISAVTGEEFIVSVPASDISVTLVADS